ncbi:putative glycoside hydrolase family 18, catalytic domain, glycoside hydrolase superfamily [Plasmopara halstedii]
MKTLLLLTLNVFFLSRWLQLSVGAFAVEHDDDIDEVEEDEDDVFDFTTSKLDHVKSKDLVEVECNDQECAISATDQIHSVWERGLVTFKPKVKSILEEHARAATRVEKHSKGETLGYVTPWNSRGYDWAKKYRAKLTYVSPVWLQVRENPDHVPIITGTQDIDRRWMLDVKNGVAGQDMLNEGPEIVPRVVYERNRLVSEDVPVIIDKILELVNKHEFDGIVFEIPVQEGTVDMLQQIGRAFRAANKLLILVLSRCSQEGELPVTHEMFNELAPLVHRFSINAYDYSMPGPNAPYTWLEKTLKNMSPMERQKVLMGLPFYGYDNTDAITGSTYIQSLSENEISEIRWDAKAHECHHSYSAAQTRSHHVVFYPCLQFLQDRLKLFREQHVGVAIWELGQGTMHLFNF